MMRCVVTLFALVLLAGSVQAIRPPDAKAREPQIRAHLQELRTNYEKKQVERQAEAVRAYDRTRADIFTPPWMRTETQAAGLSGADQTGVANAGKTQKRNHRFLVSVVLLILIGAGVGWARYKTREIDE